MFDHLTAVLDLGGPLWTQFEPHGLGRRRGSRCSSRLVGQIVVGGRRRIQPVGSRAATPSSRGPVPFPFPVPVPPLLVRSSSERA